MANPMFSLIVPVYNVAQYLPQCIESVLAQDFADFELILVNDGSPDHSLEICQSYAAKDFRIKVIDKPNGGASTARNEGIAASAGTYLLFVDSDDYIESPDLLSEVYKTIQKTATDIVLYNGKNYNMLNGKTSIQRGNYDLAQINPNDYLGTVKYLVENGQFPGSAWVFAIKADVVKQNHLAFRTGIIAEDIDWCAKVFTVAHSIDAVNGVFYAYRKNQSASVSNNAGLKGINSIMSIIEDWRPKLNHKEALGNMLLHNLGYYYFTSFVSYSKLDESAKETVRERMKKNFPVTKYVRHTKLKVLRILCQILGIDGAARLSGAIYKRKEKMF
ncbi:Glycosyl transferase family 2 [Flavobacterium longum]|uniref:glycosyltransferase family 2 protein n=1 Tax=Flavobacterium longum TaxID=1299340 RepID=UPI0039E92549